MDPWSIGLTVLVVVGLAAVVFGVVWDRRRHARRVAELLNPPRRDIPGLTGATPRPRYVSELQARRPPPDAPSTDLTAEQRAAVDDAYAGADVVHAGYASPAFVTDSAGRRAVLDDPLVAVCSDPVASVRELLGLLEHALRGKRALVLIAPSFHVDVLATLEVNRIQRRLALVALRDPGDVGTKVAALTGAAPLDRRTLQSGYVDPADLGTCRIWISTAAESAVVGARKPAA